MKFSYYHLRKFISLPPPNALADLINTHITEVEGVEERHYPWSKVVVAEILDIAPHPHAERLQLAEVAYAPGRKLKVVCGASNIAVGQKVPLALAGARLGGNVLKAVEIRGIKSRGMLCSETELGLGNDAAGIFILDEEAKVGESLEKALGLPEKNWTINLKILSNRPDLASYLGLARDLAAVEGETLDTKSFLVDFKPSLKPHFKIGVDVPQLCPEYFGVLIDGVSFHPSPFWLRDLLEISGFQSSGGVVDLTNLVLLEVGQPLHAFDRKKLSGAQIKIRTAKKNEKLAGLDGNTYELKASDLVIADSARAQALAGIMGDRRSAVSKETHSVVFESATFNLYNLRRTSRRLGLRTEALGRFERGLSSYFAWAGVARLLKLLKDFVPEAKVEEIVQVVDKKYLPQPQLLKVDKEKINRLYQTPFSSATIERVLGALGCKVSRAGNILRIKPAPWRLDLREAADLSEELGRISGVDKIESSMPIIKPAREYQESPLGWQYPLSVYMTSAGLDEIQTHSFTSPEICRKTGFPFDEKKYVKLANPLSSEWTHLRKSLLPSLILKASENLRHEEIFHAFELSKVFESGEDECWSLAMIFADKKGDPFFAAKGVIESLGKFYNLKFSFREKEDRTLEVLLNKTAVGVLYGLEPRTSFRLDLPAATVVAEMDIGKISAARRPRTFHPYSRFPGVSFDIAVLIDRKYEAAEIAEYIQSLDSLIFEAEAFDLYVGKEIPKDKKSLTFRIALQSFERTLADKEVQAIEKRIKDGLIRHFGAEIR